MQSKPPNRDRQPASQEEMLAQVNKLIIDHLHVMGFSQSAHLLQVTFKPL